MSKRKRKKQKPHIRWLIRRDMEEVLDIESEAFEYHWTEGDFIRMLRQRNVIGLVAEVEERTVGFIIYSLHHHQIDLLNFAVHQDFRRQGVGREIIDKMKDKLSTGKRNRIVCVVRETNMDALMFFKSQGFLASSILCDHYDETHEDGIVLEYRHQQQLGTREPANRIAGYFKSAFD